MRPCWTEHDKCTINCPCNESCPDGCPEPHGDHQCKTWFCLDKEPFKKVCKREGDPNREACDSNDQWDCVNNKKCCWHEYYPNDQGVPWCYQQEYEVINLP